MKIVVGGQMGKEEIKELAILTGGDGCEVMIKDDVAPPWMLRTAGRTCIWVHA